MIDLYCERTGPELWAEPLNAGTNLLFLVAAYFAWRLAGQRGLRDPNTSLLCALIAAIGIGSMLFHVFATRWAAAADVIPIALFQIAYLWSYGGRVIGWRWPTRLLAVAAFITGGLLSARLPQVLNGSLAYAPAFIMLLGLGVYHRRHVPLESMLLLAASGVLALSLTARSIDMVVCDQFPFGTHFIWHVLDGLVLYLAFRGLVAGVMQRGARLHRAPR